MLQIDTEEYRRMASSARRNAESIMESTIDINGFVNKVEVAWISQASSEYCEKIKNITEKMKNTAYDLNGLSKRINSYVNDIIAADHEAAEIIGGGSSGGNSSSQATTQSVVLDRYKAKNYSTKGVVGATGYEGYGGYYYQNDSIGAAVAQFNDNSGWVSCTFTTLHKLHSKELGYPFDHVGDTSGGQWFDNCAADSANKYAGVEGFRQMVNEYMESDQTEPLRNIVVSFDSGQYGHVLFIDGIHKDGEITFYDNSWGPGFETRLYAENLTTEAAIKAVDNAPVHGMQVEEFLNHYKWMDMNGAVIIGNN